MKKGVLIFVIFSISLIACKQKILTKNNTSQTTWETELEKNIKLLGHRNWIVVADAAYPLQSNPGIKTILSTNSHTETIAKVNQLISEQTHIKPIIYFDKEIDFIDDSDAPGMSKFKTELNQLLNENTAQKMLHENIIELLDKSSQLFNVIIIKTDFTIPYTSVFFQLDCKYWNSEAEQKLRTKMQPQNQLN